jgi:uncharacterized damage-inducible protein DinB
MTATRRASSSQALQGTAVRAIRGHRDPGVGHDGGVAEVADDDRTGAPLIGDERSVLAGFLRWQRETLERKCAGLGPDDLARRAVEPSTLSLLGIVRHMAEVERGWFRRVMASEDAPRHYCTEQEPDGDFDGAVAAPEVVADAWRMWRSEVDFADGFVTRALSLDVTGEERWRGAISLRWVLVHMIEEYARHNGHADLLRQRIDGTVGE